MPNRLRGRASRGNADRRFVLIVQRFTSCAAGVRAGSAEDALQQNDSEFASCDGSVMPKHRCRNTDAEQQFDNELTDKR